MCNNKEKTPLIKDTELFQSNVTHYNALWHCEPSNCISLESH